MLLAVSYVVSFPFPIGLNLTLDSVHLTLDISSIIFHLDSSCLLAGVIENLGHATRPSGKSSALATDEVPG